MPNLASCRLLCKLVWNVVPLHAGEKQNNLTKWTEKRNHFLPLQGWWPQTPHTAGRVWNSRCVSVTGKCVFPHRQQNWHTGGWMSSLSVDFPRGKTCCGFYLTTHPPANCLSLPPTLKFLSLLLFLPNIPPNLFFPSHFRSSPSLHNLLHAFTCSLYTPACIPPHTPPLSTPPPFLSMDNSSVFLRAAACLLWFPPGPFQGPFPSQPGIRARTTERN